MKVNWMSAAWIRNPAGTSSGCGGAGDGGGEGKIILESGETISAEAFTTDAAGLIVVTQAGSTSGSASVLNGVTTT